MNDRRLYTHSGDARKTGILGGVRLSKHSSRIEAIGSLDELNSFLGFLLSLSDNLFRSRKERKMRASFRAIIEQTQKDFFVIGADLSSPLIRDNAIPHPLHHHYPRHTNYRVRRVPQITHEHVHRLEEWIDLTQAQVPPLNNFILPQGNPVGSFLQVVRAICRRTERRAVQLAVHSKVNPLILAYLNRLSDLFFVLARAVNSKSKKTEIIWSHRWHAD